MADGGDGDEDELLILRDSEASQAAVLSLSRIVG